MLGLEFQCGPYSEPTAPALQLNLSTKKFFNFIHLDDLISRATAVEPSIGEFDIQKLNPIRISDETMSKMKENLAEIESDEIMRVNLTPQSHSVITFEVKNSLRIFGCALIISESDEALFAPLGFDEVFFDAISELDGSEDFKSIKSGAAWGSMWTTGTLSGTLFIQN